MRRLSALRGLLETSVPRPRSPRLRLEQYRTPPEIALEMVSLLPSRCRVVVDLGTGTGMLAYAAVLGRGVYTVGVDIDEDVVKEARRSPLYEVALVDFVVAAVENLPLRSRAGSVCVVQNPPFGTVRRGADRVFVEAAAGLDAEAIVSLHLYSPRAGRFLAKLYEGLGYHVELVETLRFPIPAMYRHHFKRIHYAAVVEVLARRVKRA